MKTALAYAVVLFSLQNAFAEFSPSNYAIYQFDRGTALVTEARTSMTVAPIKSAGVTHELGVIAYGADFLINKSDTTKWTMGPGWLLPENDSTSI
jgi:hypothetical protein